MEATRVCSLLQTMGIKANDALVLATFPFESDKQILKNASNNVDNSVKRIYGNIH